MMLANSKARSSALDGLRGVAAFVVVIHHLMQSFFPGVYWGREVTLHSPLEIVAGNSPIALLWAGHFAVCVFFVMSGYALSAMMAYSSLGFFPQVARRYIRLTIPILISSILSFWVFSQGWFFNLPVSEITHSQFSLAHAAHIPGSFLDLLFDALLNVYAHLSDKVEYVGDVLWTMRYEMTGSLLIMVLYSLFKPFLSRAYFKWLLLALLFVLAIKNMYYALFAMGALLFELGDTKLSLPAKLSAPIFLLALYLGSVPYYMTDYWVDGNRWHALGLDPDMTTAQMLHALGSVLLVGVVLFSGLLNRALEAFIPQFLGRVSFMLYLSHYIVICSVGSWIFLALHQFNGPYIESVLPAFVATVGVSLLLAWALTKYVDEPGVMLSKKAASLLNTAWLTKRAKEA